LNGGAKFGTTSASSNDATKINLSCSYTDGTTKYAAFDSPAAANDTTVAAFKLLDGTLSGNTCVLSLPNSGLKLASGKKDYGVTLVARHNDPSSPDSQTQNGTIVTFVQGLQMSLTVGEVTVDVTSPSVSKRFVANKGSVYAASGLTASLGAFKYIGVEEVRTLSGSLVKAALADAIANYAQSVTIVLSGAPLAAVQATALTAQGSTAGVFISNDGCLTSAALGGGSLINAIGTQVSFTIDAAYVNPNPNVGMNVCMNANGTSTIDRGAISFAISASAAGSSQPNVGILDTTLVKVVKNGTSVKVLNIPNPQNTVDQAFIRFYNMGAGTGKVFGTLYDQNTGAVLGTPNATLIDNFAQNNAVAMTAEQLASKLSITPDPTTGQSWAGRAWLQLDSEFTGLRVQALVRSNGAGGVLVNMSDRVRLDE